MSNCLCFKMKKFYVFFCFFFLLFIAFLISACGIFEYHFYSINKSALKRQTEKPILIEDNFTFKDLNNNGSLDIYEDSRKSVEARVDDLLSQMTIEEKVGLMWQPALGMGENGEVLGMPNLQRKFMGSTYDMLLNKHIRHFNLFMVAPPENHAAWYNTIQKICEQDRLGIPVTISSDPRHGMNNFLDSDLLDSWFSVWPEPLGMAAIGDSLFVLDFGRIAAQEYKAVGIRAALHPMADLATEPRWARVNGTFGEDAHLSAKLTAAYIYGFQGDSLDKNSVACMTKHWPGGGPQKEGEDAHLSYGKDQIYPGNNFNYHLIPFIAALKAHTAMMMPYYGVPVGQTSEDIGMSFNKEIITGLLREKYAYEGVVCSDWGIIEGEKVLGYTFTEARDYGLENEEISEKIKKAIDAGIDQFGGNSNTDELIQLIKENQIPESRIDASVRRLLRVKFQLGLFDDPYVDVSEVDEIVRNPEFVEQGNQAQRMSIVLLKNKKEVLPLHHGLKIYAENIDKDVLVKYGMPVESVEEADFCILHLYAPFQERNDFFIERYFHQGDLDFKEPERSRIVAIAEKKPTIVCLYLDRPPVMPEINAVADGLLVEFGSSDEAILDVIFGNFNPTGKLPIEIPSSMEAIKNQKEDVPYDSKNPLYPFGFGLSYN